MAERTARFGEEALKFARGIGRDGITEPVLKQLVRSSTSIGANYQEADGAESKRDFRHKISIAKKEAQETMHRFRMRATAHPPAAIGCRQFRREAHELTLIFGAILKGSSDD